MEALRFLATRFPTRLQDFDNVDYGLEDDELVRPRDSRRAGRWFARIASP